jgi:hypothetical protein
MSAADVGYCACHVIVSSDRGANCFDETDQGGMPDEVFVPVQDDVTWLDVSDKLAGPVGPARPVESGSIKVGPEVVVSVRDFEPVLLSLDPPMNVDGWRRADTESAL